MLVTIIADASFCQDTRTAGYGFWVASERGKLQGGGPMKRPVKTSVLAEAKAVCIALNAAVRAGLVVEGDEVLLQTDCFPAIHLLQQVGGPRELEVKEVQEFFTNLQARVGIRTRLKYVKGHTNNKDARSVCNAHCDRRAKKGLAQAREIHNQLKEIPNDSTQVSLSDHR